MPVLMPKPRTSASWSKPMPKSKPRLNIHANLMPPFTEWGTIGISLNDRDQSDVPTGPYHISSGPQLPYLANTETTYENVALLT